MLVANRVDPSHAEVDLSSRCHDLFGRSFVAAVDLPVGERSPSSRRRDLRRTSEWAGMSADFVVPDTEQHGLLALLPAGARPYAMLARFDRPIGAWLLFWPVGVGDPARGRSARSGRRAARAVRDRGGGDARRGVRLQRHRRSRSRPARRPHAVAAAGERAGARGGGVAFPDRAVSGRAAGAARARLARADRCGGEPRARRLLSVHEADHLVAAGVAGDRLLLGGAGRLGGGDGRFFRAGGCCSMRAGSRG